MTMPETYPMPDALDVPDAVDAALLDLYGRVQEDPPYTRCRAIKAGGERCKGRLNLSVTGLCLFHDPERAVEAREVRLRGSQRSIEVDAELRGSCPSPTTKVTSLEDVAEHMDWAIRAMECGAIDGKTGREIVYSLDRLRATIRDKELERKFRALQAELVKLKRADS